MDVFELGAEQRAEEIGMAAKVIKQRTVDRAQNGLCSYPIVGYGEGLLLQFEQSIIQDLWEEVHTMEDEWKLIRK